MYCEVTLDHIMSASYSQDLKKRVILFVCNLEHTVDYFMLLCAFYEWCAKTTLHLHELTMPIIGEILRVILSQKAVGNELITLFKCKL